MTLGRLYLKPLTTPSGNRGHEWVAMVPASTVAYLEKRRAAERVAMVRWMEEERERRECAEERRVNRAIAVFAREWALDLKRKG